MFEKLAKKYEKQIKFIQCNFRIVLSLSFVVAIGIVYNIIYNLPAINKLSKNLNYSVIIVLSVFFIFSILILKSLNDLFGIIFTNKSEGGVMKKSSKRNRG